MFDVDYSHMPIEVRIDIIKCIERKRIVEIIKKRIKNCKIKNSPCFVCEELKDLWYEIKKK